MKVRRIHTLMVLLIGLLCCPLLAQKPELVVQAGHTREINSVAYRPDGRIVATGSGDRTIKLWDVSTGQLLRTLTGHSGDVSQIAFNPDGQTLASASDDHTIKVWDVATGQCLRTLICPDQVRSIVYSPDGKQMVSACWDSTIRFWDAGTGQPLRTIAHVGFVAVIAFSPDGKQLVSANGKALTHRTGADAGDLPDGAVCLWDVPTGQKIRELNQPTEHSAGVYAVAYRPDGKTIAGGDQDGNVTLWDVQTGQTVRTLSGHVASVNSVAFSPDGKRLVGGSWDKTATVWNPDTGQTLVTFKGHTDYVNTVTFSPDGTTVASGGLDDALRLWDASTGQPIETMSGKTAVIRTVRFSPDGKTLALGSDDGTVKLWDVTTGRLARTLTNTDDFCLEITPDSKTIIVGTNSGTIGLWDSTTGHLIQTLTGHTSFVWSLAVRPDGRSLTSGGADGQIILWDLSTGKQTSAIALKGVIVFTLAYSADGQKMAAGLGTDGLFGQDGSLVLWRTGQKLLGPLDQTGRVQAAAFSPDGKMLATGSLDGLVRLWNADTGQRIAALKGHTDGINSLAYTPDGKLLATGSSDGSVKLWDTSTHKVVQTLIGQSTNVRSLSISPNGKFLAAASEDGTVTLWTLPGGKEVATLFSLGTSDWAVVTPDGRFDASESGLQQMHYTSVLSPIDLSQLKDRYYEPGLLAKLLGYSKEPLRDVSAFDHVDLYPQVQAPTTVPDDGKLTVALTNQGGGIGRVQVLVNGKEVTADARGPQPDPDAKSSTVTVDISHVPGLILGQSNTVSIVAWNAAGYLSSPRAEIIYHPKGQTTAAPPELWAIVGGISTYASPRLQLNYSAKDAADFAQALEIGAKRLFGADKVHLTLLTTDSSAPNALAPIKANFVKAFTEARKARPGDVLVVYLAGHGLALAQQNSLYCYLTADATSGDPASLATDSVLRGQTTLSSEELTTWTTQIPALKQVLVLDTCAAGAAAADLTEKRDISGDQVRALDRLKDRTGLHVLMGCAADAVSYETSRYGQGLLTYSLLEAMKGAKLRDDQFAEVSDLFEFAADEVPRLAGSIGGIQQPRIAEPLGGGSFPIGEFLAEDKAAIPLAQARPMLLSPELIGTTEDLNLEDLLKAKLRDLAVTARSGLDSSNFALVESSDFPGAIQPRGTYTVAGDVVTVTLQFRKDGKTLPGTTVTGSKSDIPGLIDHLVTAINTALGAGK